VYKKEEWEKRLEKYPELLTTKETQTILGVGRKEVGRLVARELLEKHSSFVKTKIYKISVIEFLTTGAQ
jgi:hypothetical protein